MTLDSGERTPRHPVYADFASYYGFTQPTVPIGLRPRKGGSGRRSREAQCPARQTLRLWTQLDVRRPEMTGIRTTDCPACGTIAIPYKAPARRSA